jgi:hypothetical protein
VIRREAAKEGVFNFEPCFRAGAMLLGFDRCEGIGGDESRLKKKGTEMGLPNPSACDHGTHLFLRAEPTVQ